MNIWNSCDRWGGQVVSLSRPTQTGAVMPPLHTDWIFATEGQTIVVLAGDPGPATGEAAV